jgi:hypothetical protein
MKDTTEAKVKAFKDEIDVICKRHNFAFESEDPYCGLVVVEYTESSRLSVLKATAGQVIEK